MNWAGKTFISADEVQPIVVYDTEGKRRYAEEISGGGARVGFPLHSSLSGRDAGQKKIWF